MGRFALGDTVWITPDSSGKWVNEDEAVIVDDLGDGYVVIQIAERVPSHGSGHFVRDTEVQQLAA